jgi:hypothetical protein
MDFQKKLEQLIEELQKARLDIAPAAPPQGGDNKPKDPKKKKSTGAILPHANAEDHPKTIRPENLKRLIKEECKIAKNGQWSLEKSSDEDSSLEKGAYNYKVREYATKLAGSGPVKPHHMERAKTELDAKAKSEAKKAAKNAPPKPDRSKVPVTHITSAKAVSEGHENHYELTHHRPDGSSSTEKTTMDKTGIRIKNPNKTHAIHLKGHEPVHTDEATAHKALKEGHFNLEAHLSGKPKS